MSVNNPLQELQRIYWSRDYRDNFERGETFVRDWRSKKNMRERDFFALTLTPKEKTVHTKGIWYDIDARERFVATLWQNVKHQTNRRMHNNYRRHPKFELLDLAFYEHHKKGSNTVLCTPHLHAAIAVNHQCLEEFNALLKPAESPFFSLNLTDLDRDDIQIDSVHVRRIPSHEDLCCWIGYCAKQQYLAGEKEHQQLRTNEWVAWKRDIEYAN